MRKLRWKDSVETLTFSLKSDIIYFIDVYKRQLAGCPTCRKGARGNITRLIQEKLGVAVDGIFGQKTKNAVIAFQRAHGLTADGIVGKNTWRALLGL